jgi:hypothetical protein
MTGHSCTWEITSGLRQGEERNRSRSGRIQRIYRSVHFDFQEHVAPFGKIRPDTVPLGAHNQNAWSRDWGLPKERSIRAIFDSDDPKPSFLQSLQLLRQIYSLDDGKMLDCSGGCIDSRRCDAGRPVLWNKNGRDAECLGGTQHGSDILRILEMVERQHRTAPFFERGGWRIGVRRCQGGDSLVVDVGYDTIDRFSIDTLDWHPELFGSMVDRVETRIIPGTLQEEDTPELAACRG